MRKILVLGLLLALSSAMPEVLESSPCGAAEATSGTCVGGANQGSSTEVGASQTGIRDGTNESVPGADGSKDPRPEYVPGRSAPAREGAGLGDNPRVIRDTLNCDSEECDPEQEQAPVFTISDFASFTPATPSIAMEPAGWIVRGLPANFVADASINEHQGELLGQPVVVRFEPVSYSWDWGDGTSDVFDTPGRSWDELGVARFTNTATSHEYSESGPVTVRVAVEYAVDYSFGEGSWTAVAGTVSATTVLDAVVVTARTVLVDGDCAEDPSGPGC